MGLTVAFHGCSDENCPVLVFRSTISCRKEAPVYQNRTGAYYFEALANYAISGTYLLRFRPAIIKDFNTLLNTSVDTVGIKAILG